MAKTFQVGVYSKDNIIYEGQAVSMMAPSVFGYLGILADHAPLVAKLASGKITIRNKEGQASTFNSSPQGFLQVLKNQVTLLL